MALVKSARRSQAGTEECGQPGRVRASASPLISPLFYSAIHPIMSILTEPTSDRVRARVISGDDGVGDLVAQIDLISAVLELADGDQKLTDNTRLLILGALDSDQALQDALDGTGQSLSEAAAVSPEAHAPIGAYLRSVRVAGFRGVGSALTVPLHPGPGLTVIAGRNGSGKSSIAEALEMALTGSSYRWSKQSNAVWTAKWRNLHGDVPAEIRVELAEEGQGVTTIGVDWSSDAGLTDGTHWVQRPGAKRQPGRETLGWAVPLSCTGRCCSTTRWAACWKARPAVCSTSWTACSGCSRSTMARPDWAPC